MTARAQDKRVWLGGAALLGVVIALIGWFGFINPQLTAAASTRDQAESAQVQNMVLQAQNSKLKKENDNVAALRAGLSAALAGLPSDGGLPAFTRQVSAQATAHSVALTSLNVSTAAPVAAAVEATGTAESGTTTTTSATSATSDTSGTSDTSLVQLTVTMTATGLGRDDLAFLKAIQMTGPRRALVTASQLAPSGGSTAAGIDGSCTLTLTLNIFSAPLSPTDQAALEKLLSGK